jgi:transmembrane sensor
MTWSRDPVRIAVAGQAAEWFVANQGAAADDALRSEFVAWLKASPMHIEEYLGVAVIARDLRILVDDADLPLQTHEERARDDDADRVVPISPLLSRESRERRIPQVNRWSIWVAAAATIALAVSVAWWTLVDRSSATAQWYRTQHGEQSMQRLADGSTLHLNTDTAVEVTFDDDARNLRIDGGQALFTVAHGDPRRFRVTAGKAEIIAVGTQFDVRLKGQSTLVTVVEGQVDVLARSSRSAAIATPARVTAGYRLQIDGGIIPAQGERVDAQAATAWLHRKIVFEREPLGEVADEFNRYGLVQLSIKDAGLRALPVSGVFNAYDVNSFAEFLETLDGVRVERTPAQIRVMRQDAGESVGALQQD